MTHLNSAPVVFARSYFILTLVLVGSINVAAMNIAASEILFKVNSDRGTTLQVSSDLAPIPINQIHSWQLQLTDTYGNPVSGATIIVEGGMPLHDHGLPTLPGVTGEIGAGIYLLQGVRFHMPGQWQLNFRVEHGIASEDFSIDFSL